MRIFHRFYIVCLILMPVTGFAQPKLILDGTKIVAGETLNYKARWGFLTIGSATTRIDKTLYKVGLVVLR